jgi:hypothetical protein
VSKSAFSRYLGMCQGPSSWQNPRDQGFPLRKAKQTAILTIGTVLPDHVTNNTPTGCLLTPELSPPGNVLLAERVLPVVSGKMLPSWKEVVYDVSLKAVFEESSLPPLMSF